MVILWGPMAGFVQSHAPDTYTALTLASAPEMKFDFSIAMAVRPGDDKRKQMLNELIDKNRDKIQAIISEYHVPLLPLLPQQPVVDDDD